MCGDRKVAIISAILIAIRAPLIVRLFENNRDYLKIIATIFCAKCVRTVNENRTGFLYPIMQGGRSILPVCVRCVYTNNTHASLEPVRFGSRFFCLCGHA